jgi:hypothetical protein
LIFSRKQLPTPVLRQNFGFSILVRLRFSQSYADLLILTPIHRTFFPAEQIATHRLAKLSSEGTMALQHAISEHFGVQFGFDHEDLCTQAGRYRCSKCFHVGNGVNLKNMNANQPFGACEVCGEEAAWVKMPV